jgi:ABC-2 type transport system permease protein
MNILKSWRALMVREFLEHRMPFLYFPLGIVALLVLSGVSSLGFNKVRLISGLPVAGSGAKIFELGYLVLIAMWLAYLAVTLFFFFGDAFSADKRNNAMFFWKSMPVSDLKILASKFFTGVLLFPAIILGIAAVTGLIFYLWVNVATLAVPGLISADPLAALATFVQVSIFAIAHTTLALLWYAPFLAWVGGLSTVFGRWSLPLAFVIPGLIVVLENVAFLGNIPRGGYFWAFLSQRLQYGLSDLDLGRLVMSSAPFDAVTWIGRLAADTDWLQMGEGVVFAALVMWLASEYRRRRIA